MDEALMVYSWRVHNADDLCVAHHGELAKPVTAAFQIDSNYNEHSLSGTPY